MSSVRAAAVGDVRGNSPPDERLYLLLLDEMNLARVENYGADLLSVLGAEGAGRVLNLYPQSTHARWERELGRLRQRESALSGDDEDRRSELESALQRRKDGSSPNALPIPRHLVVLGTLNTDRHTHELSPKLFDRSYVLVARPPAPEQALVARRHEPDDDYLGPTLPELRLPDDPWPDHGTLRGDLVEVLRTLSHCGIAASHRTGRLASAYVATAAALGENRPGQMLGDLVDLLVLSRLECAHEAAVEPLRRVEALLKERIPADHDVLPRLAALRREAERPTHVDLRGLRA